MTHYYFSYGMNTSPGIMARHDYCIPIGKAILEGHHLAFKYHATIEPGGSMVGVLWEIDDKTLDKLDAQEGFPDYYNRELFSVVCNGITYQAQTYFMTHNIPQMIISPRPSDAYIKHMIHGYRAFGIPLEQLTSAITHATITENQFYAI